MPAPTVYDASTSEGGSQTSTTSVRSPKSWGKIEPIGLTPRSSAQRISTSLAWGRIEPIGLSPPSSPTSHTLQPVAPIEPVTLSTTKSQDQPIAPISGTSIVDDDSDEEGWQEMPVVREDEFMGGLDEEDQKRYHYQPQTSSKTQSQSISHYSSKTKAANATGNVTDIDDRGVEWRSKLSSTSQVESEYTRLKAVEDMDDDKEEELLMRTKYLFDEDKAMTPLSQMQATKELLTEAQRVAYVGLCEVVGRGMVAALRTPISGTTVKKDGKDAVRKEMKAALADMELWRMKIMGRLYYHMELETPEQKMIESLAEHGVLPMDLVPALMTTHTVANPEYDPEVAASEARKREEQDDDDDDKTLAEEPSTPTPTTPSLGGVSTTLSVTDESVTLDIRWTVLCDLFLILIADSVYDARSRVLLSNVAHHLGLSWTDVVRFECRVSEALEIQEGVDRLENTDVVEGRARSNQNKRYMMLGLATLGGGLVIGLSAGLLAPVIGAGLGAAFTTIGIGGTTGFLAGAGGAAVITTGGVLTGGGIAGRGMVRRTQQVRTFELLPLHNNKRVSCVLTVPGFLQGAHDDPRLPFSVLDPVVGDVFSVLWEPEMIRETGSALKILTGEVLSQISTTVLQATVMTALMSALQWPIVLTKLGYLIDNPWNNALDRARAAGGVLADVLIRRHLGVRPIVLVGFSLGARVIFYALVELAKQKAFGIVQDVYLLGATLTASQSTWLATRSVVSGRYVNAYATNDWVLNYLFRATSGGVGCVAGLRAVEGVSGLENVDVTEIVTGHMSYRVCMPLLLERLGWEVVAKEFDEPEDPDYEEEPVAMDEEDATKNKGWFSRKKAGIKPTVSRPPSAMPSAWTRLPSSSGTITPTKAANEDLPPREVQVETVEVERQRQEEEEEEARKAQIPKTAGFDLNAIREAIEDAPPERSTTPTPLPKAPPTESMPTSGTIERDWDEPPSSTTPQWEPDTLPQKSKNAFGGGTFGSSTSSLVDNPFGGKSINSSGWPSASDSAGLSFGGMDGSITTSSGSAMFDDPWSIPPPRKSATGFTSGNPWG